MTSPNLTLELHEESYPILGSTLNDLMTGIGLLGPRLGGRAFGGATWWELSWSVGAIANGARFDVGEVEIKVHARILLPSWRAPLRATPEVVRAFERYRAHLRAHERGHVALALASARRLRAKLVTLPGHSTVSQVLSHADALGQRATADCRRAQRAYDLQTAHGGAHELVLSRLVPAYLKGTEP